MNASLAAFILDVNSCEPTSPDTKAGYTSASLNTSGLRPASMKALS